MKYYIFKQTPLPKILGIKNGYISFVCTCGAVGKVHIRNFNKLSRCKICTLKSKQIQLKKSDKLKQKDNKLILFDIFLKNGLLNIVKDKVNV